MAIFFFVVTLEIKREFIQGELSRSKQALLPIIGDPLTFVAGAMRIRFLDFLILVAIGKVGRYLIVMLATDWTLNLF